MFFENQQVDSFQDEKMSWKAHGKKRALVVVTSCTAIIVTIALVFAVWSPFGSSDATQTESLQQTFAEAQAARVATEEDTKIASSSQRGGDKSPLLLSNWAEFDVYWEDCADADATYRERSENGSLRCYKLKDEYVGSDALKEAGLTQDANVDDFAISFGNEANFDGWLMNTSTGVLYYIKFSDSLAKRYSAFGESIVKKNPSKLALYADKFVVYEANPVTREYLEKKKLGKEERENGLPSGRYISEIIDESLNNFGSGDRNRLIDAVNEGNAIKEVREAIIEKYGKKAYVDALKEVGFEEGMVNLVGKEKYAELLNELGVGNED